MKNNKNNYNSKSIKILEGLEAVRKRPGMYIGNTSSSGLHHLVWEILDNSIDESLAGYCDEITIILNKNNLISIEDNGRGIPIDIHHKSKKPTVETIFTTLHAGGKFDNKSYKISGGLHGVGSSVTNALSELLEVEIYINNFKYLISFEKGGKLKQKLIKKEKTNKKGTKVTFLPDSKIFKENSLLNYSTIEKRAKEISYLNKNLKINLINKQREKISNKVFYHPNGIKDYIDDLIKYKNSTKITKNFYSEKNYKSQYGEINIECSFSYSNSYDKNNVFSFCNNINTSEGGTHEDGLHQVLVFTINKFFSSNDIKNKKNINFNRFSWEDISEGLFIIISIKHYEPQYEGQTKNKLTNRDAKQAVNNALKEEIYSFLNENPESTKIILKKLLTTQRGRLAAEKAKEEVRRKDLLNASFSLPGKLSDCQSKNVEETELFLVEGESAGGSARLGRDRYFQAILSLKGKVLNVQKVTSQKISQNKEILSILTALGFTSLQNIDIENIRYGKVIIMTDADVDGSHIRVLLLTLFHKYFKNLIINKKIYIAQPPLYKLTVNKKEYYLFSNEELNQKLDENKGLKYSLQRYKGLGEMNPNQLWKTTMDPANRILKQVVIEDAIEAEQIIWDLMGDNVKKRRDFINENALFIKTELNI